MKRLVLPILYLAISLSLALPLPAFAGNACKEHLAGDHAGDPLQGDHALSFLRHAALRHYLLAISLFEGDGKLRRILNERDPGYAVSSEALAKVTFNYNSIGNRARVRKAIKFYEKGSDRFKSAVEQSPEAGYLSLLIAQSPSYSMVDKWSPFYVISRKIEFLTGVTTDTLTGMEREGVSLPLPAQAANPYPHMEKGPGNGKGARHVA